MPEWKGIVGRQFSPEEFKAYVAGLDFSGWQPKFIVLHNTGEPTLAQRPDGLTREHILGLQEYYRDEQGWSVGPHLFVDDHGIWVFTPLTVPGVHSPSWNRVAWGVEMLGDYDSEDFDSGRGLAVRRNAVAAVAILSGVLGIDPATMRLHREDPETTHHCPGDHVDKAAFIQAVSDFLGAGAPRQDSVPPQTQIPAPVESILAKVGNLQAALDFVLGDDIEGGYVNNPADPGGETKFGICKRYHPDVDIKNLSREGAMAIYAREYWALSTGMSCLKLWLK
jgi:Glycosyl hydrolase 108/N-acetylmuramoyl-L-alanine amidase